MTITATGFRQFWGDRTEEAIEAAEDDQRWFANNPGKLSRVRPPKPYELEHCGFDTAAMLISRIGRGNYVYICLTERELEELPENPFIGHSSS